jgi:hypothetical protein
MMRDDSYATLQLGVDYLAGKCGEQNLGHAFHYLTMAEQMGEDFATECIAKLREAYPEFENSNDPRL